MGNIGRGSTMLHAMPPHSPHSTLPTLHSSTSTSTCTSVLRRLWLSEVGIFTQYYVLLLLLLFQLLSLWRLTANRKLHAWTVMGQMQGGIGQGKLEGRPMQASCEPPFYATTSGICIRECWTSAPTRENYDDSNSNSDIRLTLREREKVHWVNPRVCVCACVCVTAAVL